ncbi:MAG: hypothetical protein AB1847_21460 [bacterium]
MLSGDVLGTAIAAALIADQGEMSAAEEAVLIAKWKIIAGQIVSHITNNAVVNVTTTGATGTGPSGGPLPITAQPGVGTVS